MTEAATIDWYPGMENLTDDNGNEWYRWGFTLSEPYYFDSDYYPWSSLDNWYSGCKHTFVTAFRGICPATEENWNLFCALNMSDEDLDSCATVGDMSYLEFRQNCFNTLYQNSQ